MGLQRDKAASGIGGPTKGKIPRTVRPAGEPGGRAAGRRPPLTLDSAPRAPPTTLMSVKLGVAGGACGAALGSAAGASPARPAAGLPVGLFLRPLARRARGGQKEGVAQDPPYWPAGELGRGPGGPGRLACRPFFTPHGGAVAGRPWCACRGVAAAAWPGGRGGRALASRRLGRPARGRTHQYR